LSCIIFKTEVKNRSISFIFLKDLKPDITFEILDKDALNQPDDQASAPTT
jgi:hypothetical protein